MSRIVMECWWRVWDLLDFKEAVRLATLLECQILVPRAKPFFVVDEEGYQRLHLFISSEVEAFMLTFANTMNLYGHFDIRACHVAESLPERGMSAKFCAILVDTICRHNYETKYGFPVRKYKDYTGFDWSLY